MGKAKSDPEVGHWLGFSALWAALTPWQRKRASELGDDTPIENEPTEASASYAEWLAEANRPAPKLRDADYTGD